jgi:hypothetical protein
MVFDKVASPRRTGTADELFKPHALDRDDESHLAATLRRTHGASDGPGAPAGQQHEARARVVSGEILRAIEARLPGRIRDLQVRHEFRGEFLQFTIHGISSSYYVKQVAGHLAMNAVEARMLARLVNDIDVHAER